MLFKTPPDHASPYYEAMLLLQEALDSVSDQIALIGRSGEVLAVNRAWVEFADTNGHRPGDTGLGENYSAVCERALAEDPASADTAVVGLRGVLAGEVEGFEHDYPRHSPTEERWFRMSVRRIAGEGRFAAIVTHSNRTSERLAQLAEADARATLDALRQQADLDRRRLEATLEAIPVGVWISDANGRITHRNPAAARIWGGEMPLPQSASDYDVYRAWSAVTGAILAPGEGPLARTLATGATISGELYEIERFDGTRAWTLTSAAPIIDANSRLTGAVAVNVDFTGHQAAVRERERLLASLERERTQLAAVFDKAPAFLAVLRGPEYVFELVNEACQQLVGHRDVIGETLAEALPELSSQGFREILDAVRATGETWTGRQTPVRLRRTPGAPLETRYVDLVYQRLEDPDGEYAVVSHGVDVTDQVLASESIARSEQRLREQFAKLPVPTYLWEEHDGDFVLLDCNDAARAALPQYGASAYGKTSRELFPGMEELDADVRRSLAENIVVRRTIEVDVGSDMGRRRFDLTIGPQQPDRVLLHAVDTTDRAELEAQLRQSQKMEAVGRLAGGVAHDFNNLLTVIGAHSAFLMESLDADGPLHEDAEAIHSAGIRAAGLTRQLLAFSRKQILKPSVIDLNATVEEARKLLGRLLGEDIEIVTELSVESQHVEADQSQIDQVLLNLAVNARDAMPSGGRLTIATRSESIVAPAPGAKIVVPPGEYSVLSVRDVGIGMDATVQGRMFEPFFTTKEPGKGTGLGLATAYGIVKQSRGHIIVESAPGAGSSFHVYLPKVAPANAHEQLHDTARTNGGIETILLVEDEPAVREVARRILTREGYEVLEAESGEAALAKSAALDSVIHLVVSDIVMPGMRGGEVVRRLQESRAGLKAILMSGYTDDEIVRRGIGESAVPFVQKPFTARELSRVVREALDS